MPSILSQTCFGLNLLEVLNSFRIAKVMRNNGHQRLRELLIEARKAAELTQAEVSKRLRRPQSFVSKYERGERRLDVVEFAQVARAIGLDPVRFLSAFYREIS